MGEIAKHGSRNVVLMYGGALIGFVNTILLYPKILPPAEFGLISLLISISMLIASISSFGAPNALVKFFSHFRDNNTKSTKGLITFLLKLSVGVALVSTILLLVFQSLVFSIYEENAKMLIDYFYFIFPIFFMQVLINLLVSWLNVLKKSYIQVFQKEVLFRVGQTVLLVLYYFDIIEIYSFVVLFVGLNVLSVVFLVGYLYSAGELSVITSGSLTQPERKKVLNFSTYTFLSGIARQISFRIDQIMVGAMVVSATVANSGLEAAGIYAIALNMSSMIEMPFRALNQSLSPSIAHAWAIKDLSKVLELYKKSTEALMVIGVYLSVGIWACIDQVIEILPSSYSEVKYVLGWLLLGKLTNVVAGPNGTVLMNSPRYRILTFLTVIGLIITVVSNYIFISWYGIEGAAMATFITYLLVNIVIWFLILSFFKLQPLTIANLLTLILGLVVWYGASYVSIGGVWMTLIAKAVLITVVFWPIAYYIKLSPEINNLIDTKVLKLLKEKFRR